MNKDDSILCFWSVGREFRFQTSSSKIAKKLSLKKGFRLVGYSVLGRYMKLFQARISPVKAKRLAIKLTGDFEPKTIQPTPIRILIGGDTSSQLVSTPSILTRGEG